MAPEFDSGCLSALEEMSQIRLRLISLSVIAFKVSSEGNFAEGFRPLSHERIFISGDELEALSGFRDFLRKLDTTRLNIFFNFHKYLNEQF